MRFAVIHLLLLSSIALSAQLNGKYTFRHIGLSEGLLHSWVKGIAQDEYGYMWFLTEGGLQRYDGHTFVNYPELQEIHPGEIFRRLYADQKGSLILKKGDRYIRFDLRKHCFSVHKPEDLFSTLPSVPEMDFTHYIFPGIGIEGRVSQDEISYVRLSPRIALAYAKGTDNVIASLLNYSMDTKRRSSWMAQDTVSDYYISFNGADLVMWNPVTKKKHFSSQDTLSFPVFNAYKKMKVPGGRALMMDSYRRLWMHPDHGVLYRVDFNTLETKIYSLIDYSSKQTPSLSAYPWGIMEDHHKNIWIITENAGLIFLNPATDELQWITSSEKYSQGLHYNFSIDDIFQDRDDNIWLATDQGINVFNPSVNYVQVISHIEDEQASIPKNEIINTFETSTGKIMVATWGGGVAIYDLQWNFIRNVKFPEIPHSTVLDAAGNVYERGLMNMAWSFAEFDDGTLWIGAQQGFLHIFDPVQQKFITQSPPEVNHSTIKRMVKDSEGNVYLGLGNGRIVFWSNAEKKFFPFEDANQKYNSYMAPLDHLIIDDAGRCWAVSEYCLLEYDKNQRTFINFHCPDDSVRPYFFRTVMQWNDSTLVVGLRGKGVLFFNMHTKRFTIPDFNSHVEHVTVGAFKKDEEGNLWMCAGGSIYKYDRELSTMSKINLGYNALRSNFDYNPMISLEDGRWVASTPSEVVCFDPRMIRSDDAVDKRVLISGFTLMKKTMNIDSILLISEPLVLQHHQNFFSIEFSSLEYLNVFDITYSYRLRGIEQEWNSTTTKHFADYTDLKPDDYVFEVKAIYGSHESVITSFPITITPPWWSTWWFRTLCIILFIALLTFLMRKRIQIIRKEAGLKHMIAETRMMALRAQMNPHFIFNCLNTIDNMIQTDQKDKATTYLGKFAKLIRAILENSKNNVIPCWKDIETLELYLDMEAIRWGQKIHYDIQVDPQIRHGDYKIPPMLIQPFVENAIHHGLLNKQGNDKQLHIIVELENETLKYTIVDNGVGREMAAAYKQLNKSSHPSMGIQITKDRIALFNQADLPSVKITDLYNHQQEPTGTKVEVWLSTQQQAA